jgi:hypothetical protein
MRVDRLLGEHGIGQDSAAGRQGFERQMERGRREAVAEVALKPRRRGWYLGREQFKEQMLELMESKLGESHSGELHRETAEQRANRIIAEELARRGWPESWLRSHPNFGPWTLDFGLRPRQAGQRCPATERNDPADQAHCGAGADQHGQRGQVRAPSSGLEPRPTQSRKSPRTLRPARIPIYGCPLSLDRSATHETPEDGKIGKRREVTERHHFRMS